MVGSQLPYALCRSHLRDLASGLTLPCTSDCDVCFPSLALSPFLYYLVCWIRVPHLHRGWSQNLPCRVTEDPEALIPDCVNNGRSYDWTHSVVVTVIISTPEAPMTFLFAGWLSGFLVCQVPVPSLMIHGACSASPWTSHSRLLCSITSSPETLLTSSRSGLKGKPTWADLLETSTGLVFQGVATCMLSGLHARVLGTTQDSSLVLDSTELKSVKEQLGVSVSHCSRGSSSGECLKCGISEGIPLSSASWSSWPASLL